MKSINFFKFVCLSAIVFLSGLAIQAQSFGGQGTAVRVTVTAPLPAPVVTTAVADTGALPDAGGNVALTNVGINVPGIITGTSSNVTTQGSGIGSLATSTSTAGVNSLSIAILNGLTLTADVVTSSTSCGCPTSCSGSSTVTNLILTEDDGTVVTINGSATSITTINAVGGAVLGTVTVNEKFTTASSVTVNAIHIELNIAGVATEVIVGSAYSAINCVGAPAINAYSGRGTGIRTELLSNSVTTLVADTGFLPTSGGILGVTTAGVNVLGGIITSGTVTSNTSGGLPGGNINTSQSDSTVEDLAIQLTPLITLEATFLRSETRCSCSLGIPTCLPGAGSTIVGLRTVTDVSPLPPIIANINVTGVPNQGFTIPGVATLIINQQIPLTVGVGVNNITRNALVVQVPLLGLADIVVASAHSDIDCGIIASAAEVSISGRVIDGSGRGIFRANLRLTGSDGIARTAITNQFGYYRFTAIPSGETYVIQAAHRTYGSHSSVINLTDDVAGLELVLDSGNRSK